MGVLPDSVPDAMPYQRINKTTMENNTSAPYTIGANYLIRTVTHTYTGKLIWVGDKELVLDTCAWIADSGRWAGAVANATFEEVEPMGDGSVIIGRGAIVDATEGTWDLPTKQK